MRYIADPVTLYFHNQHRSAAAWRTTGIRMEKIKIADELKGKTESPIETIFGAELIHKTRSNKKIIIEPQFWWNRYRVDWALGVKTGMKIFVECDGYHYHSEPEMQARDRRREQEMINAGFVVLRFSSEEIFTDPEKCVNSAICALVTECPELE